MVVGRARVGRRHAVALATLMTGALALLLLAPSGALAAKKKLSVKVASSSQTQVQNQGALKVSYKTKGLSKVSASATATPDGGSQVDFASKASKNNPKNGTLSLALTAEGQAALDDCVSLSVKVKASGSGKKANASAVLAEDDPECAKPVKDFATETALAYPTGITTGTDSAVWFAHSGAGTNSLGRLSNDGTYSQVDIPVPPDAVEGDTGGHTLNDVTTASDGAIWATSFGQDWVRRVDPATGDVEQFQVPNTSGGGSTKITPGADGSVWMGDGGQTIWQVASDGTVTEFPLSDPDHPDIFASVYGIAVGGDGAVWFTTPNIGSAGFSTTAIGRLDPGTGETDYFPLQDATNGLGYMTADRAGRLWFTNTTGNSIGRIDPNSGQIVEFQIPTAQAKPIGIAFADDGSLWFTEQMADNIGRYDPASGQFTEYPLETLGSSPFDITVGSDGKVYFTEMGTGNVGQLDPNKAPVGDPNPSNGKSQPPYGEEGRCAIPAALLCQQQANTEGSTFKINTALTQELPADTLTLTAGVGGLGAGDPLLPPSSGPMLAAKPLDVVVGGTPATTKIGLAGPVPLNALIPLSVTVPIDLYVSQPGNPAGGCVIGPIVQNLVATNDDEGDAGLFLFADTAMFASDKLGAGSLTGAWTGTLEDNSFVVPEARGCGALTDIINGLLSLPSETDNATHLPFGQTIIAGPGLGG